MNDTRHRGRLPRIGLLMGDRYGIGPELVAKLIHEPPALQSHVVVIGKPEVLASGFAITGHQATLEPVANLDGLADEPGFSIMPTRSNGLSAKPLGEVSPAVGKEVIAQLEAAADHCVEGRLDGFVFAPLNKQAMRLGGLKGQDELDHLVDHIGYQGEVGEINILGELWTTRVTAHIPLKDVAAAITPKNVFAAIKLAYHSLKKAGIDRPSLAVSGLNPHAGDGGSFGLEEIEIIGPVIEQAKAQGYDVAGPFSPDTVFLQAPAAGHHAIVTMYHDQGQIAMKMMGFGKGITLQAGLPFPVTTPAHGTAFDIAGKGIAKPDGLYAALTIAEKMAASRKSA